MRMGGQGWGGGEGGPLTAEEQMRYEGRESDP